MSRLLSILLVVVVVGGLIFGGFWFLNKNKEQSAKNIGNEEEEEVLKELPLEDKPYVAFTPGASCEYSLTVSNIKTSPAKVEYEIVYKDEAGVTQGASGSISPSSGSATKKILFGTESSGHRKCDKGVSGGDITLRYRNDEGKLTAKMTTPFSIAENESNISITGFSVSGLPAKGKHVAMGTLGLPSKAPGSVIAGPFAVFSNAKSLSGTPKLEGEGKLYDWNGSSWENVDGKALDLQAVILVSP